MIISHNMCKWVFQLKAVICGSANASDEKLPVLPINKITNKIFKDFIENKEIVLTNKYLKSILGNLF